MSTDKLFLTWEQFHQDTNQLVDKIKIEYPHPDYTKKFKGIIAIARGGYIPAVIIAHKLGIKNVRSVSMSTYDEENVKRDTVVNDIFRDDEVWLVVDELTDSGSSLKTLKEYLPASIYVTVYAKPKGINEADLYSVSVEQTRWIVFPWE